MPQNRVKLLKYKLERVFYCSFLFTSFLTFPVLAIPQDNYTSVVDTDADIYKGKQTQFFLTTQQKPPDRGTPPTKEGTGSRGNCLFKQNKPPLTRLVGGAQSKLTLKHHPTLWIYIPYTNQDSPNGEFSLQDENSEVYKTSFKLPDTPGIISISLPSTVKPLEAGKTYRWYVDIACPSASGSKTSPISLTGIVQMAPNSIIENELKTATAIERIEIYIQNGIFIDAVTELAQHRLDHPQNPTFKQMWVELLSQPDIGLGNIAQEPIIGNIENW
jgi:Domain of Unknown Function (DUF928)